MTIEPGVGGAQNERTALAWRRTGLSLLAVGAISAKFLAATFELSMAVLGVTVLLSVWIIASGSRRYVRAAASARGETAALDGKVPAVAAALTVFLGIATASLVLTEHGQDPHPMATPCAHASGAGAGCDE